MTERRREPRSRLELPVRIWGIDATGASFREDVHARDFSSTGALLTGLQCQLRSGDPLTVQWGPQYARFRVIWVRDRRAAVQKINGQSCPWGEVLKSEKSRVSAEQG